MSGRRVIRTALSRGVRKRCPHCGQGPLFSGFAHHLERCVQCGLVYERNPGDTWAFTILGDRVPIAVLIALAYFGVARAHHVLGALLFVVLGAAIVGTAPNRWGVGIAIHYLTRLYGRDPDDPIPGDRESRDLRI